jgi:hypothetical protein
LLSYDNSKNNDSIIYLDTIDSSSENDHRIINSDTIDSSRNNNSVKRLNGCILILVSNKHLKRLYNLVERLELVFNKDYNYPYVIFHYEKLDDGFKKDILNYTNSTIEYGFLPEG